MSLIKNFGGFFHSLHKILFHKLNIQALYIKVEGRNFYVVPIIIEGYFPFFMCILLYTQGIGKHVIKIFNVIFILLCVCVIMVHP